MTDFTLVTPLPPGIPKTNIVAAFHDHETMLRCGPLVQSVARTSPPTSAHATELTHAWYEVTTSSGSASTPAAHHLLPGARSHPQPYKVSLENLPVGVKAHVYQFLGSLDLHHRWTLLESTSTSGKLALREVVEMDGSMLLKPMAKKMIRKAHENLVAHLSTMVGAKPVRVTAKSPPRPRLSPPSQTPPPPPSGRPQEPRLHQRSASASSPDSSPFTRPLLSVHAATPSRSYSTPSLPSATTPTQETPAFFPSNGYFEDPASFLTDTDLAQSFLQQCTSPSPSASTLRLKKRNTSPTAGPPPPAMATLKNVSSPPLPSLPARSVSDNIQYQHQRKHIRNDSTPAPARSKRSSGFWAMDASLTPPRTPPSHQHPFTPAAGHSRARNLTPPPRLFSMSEEERARQKAKDIPAEMWEEDFSSFAEIDSAAWRGSLSSANLDAEEDRGDDHPDDDDENVLMILNKYRKKSPPSAVPEPIIEEKIVVMDGEAAAAEKRREEEKKMRLRQRQIQLEKLYAHSPSKKASPSRSPPPLRSNNNTSPPEAVKTSSSAVTQSPEPKPSTKPAADEVVVLDAVDQQIAQIVHAQRRRKEQASADAPASSEPAEASSSSAPPKAACDTPPTGKTVSQSMETAFDDLYKYLETYHALRRNPSMASPSSLRRTGITSSTAASSSSSLASSASPSSSSSSSSTARRISRKYSAHNNNNSSHGSSTSRRHQQRHPFYQDHYEQTIHQIERDQLQTTTTTSLPWQTLGSPSPLSAASSSMLLAAQISRTLVQQGGSMRQQRSLDTDQPGGDLFSNFPAVPAMSPLTMDGLFTPEEAAPPPACNMTRIDEEDSQLSEDLSTDYTLSSSSASSSVTTSPSVASPEMFREKDHRSRGLPLRLSVPGGNLAVAMTDTNTTKDRTTTTTTTAATTTAANVSTPMSSKQAHFSSISQIINAYAAYQTPVITASPASYLHSQASATPARARPAWTPVEGWWDMDYYTDILESPRMEATLQGPFLENVY